MPRSLTRNELDYLVKLKNRNDEMDPTCPCRRGLKKPMPAKERILRMRIRKKAFRMANHLALIFEAGLLPHRSIEQGSAEKLAGDIELLRILYPEKALEFL